MHPGIKKRGERERGIEKGVRRQREKEREGMDRRKKQKERKQQRTKKQAQEMKQRRERESEKKRKTKWSHLFPSGPSTPPPTPLNIESVEEKCGKQPNLEYF